MFCKLLYYVFIIFRHAEINLTSVLQFPFFVVISYYYIIYFPSKHSNFLVIFGSYFLYNKIMENQWIKTLEKHIKSNCSISNTYTYALRNTLLFLQKKDKIDKTSYYPLAQSIFCESSFKTIAYFSLNQPTSPTTIYSYKKYILKTFYCCYAELTNLPYTDDFDEIIKYLSA